MSNITYIFTSGRADKLNDKKIMQTTFLWIKVFKQKI